MKNSIGLYFNLEIKESQLAFSLIKQSLRQIEQLEDAGIQVEYLQLRANELSDPYADKQIWLKIDSSRGTYMAAHTSLEWNHAFINTLKTVEKKMLHEELGYGRPAALVEKTLCPGITYAQMNNINNGILHEI